jgi:hypothetical protein
MWQFNQFHSAALKAKDLACLTGLSLCLPPSASRADQSAVITIPDIGNVPSGIVLQCEKATGDGGHESFFDERWELFSDCVNTEMRPSKPPSPRK